MFWGKNQQEAYADLFLSKHFCHDDAAYDLFA